MIGFSFWKCFDGWDFSVSAAVDGMKLLVTNSCCYDINSFDGWSPPLNIISSSTSNSLQDNLCIRRSLLKEVKLAGITRIVLDCAAENLRTILTQAQQVGMMSGNSCFIVSILWFCGYFCVKQYPNATYHSLVLVLIIFWGWLLDHGQTFNFLTISAQDTHIKGVNSPQFWIFVFCFNCHLFYAPS